MYSCIYLCGNNNEKGCQRKRSEGGHGRKLESQREYGGDWREEQEGRSDIVIIIFIKNV